MHHTIVPEPCENEEPLIKYVNERDRPLLIAPSPDTLSLRKKVICAVLCDRRGRAFIQRRMSEEGMETWDISVETFVRSGEAREEAVERAVRETLGLFNVSSGVAVSAAFKSAGETVSLTLFIAELLGGLPPVSLSEGHFLNREELEGMMETFPDLFSPALLRAIQVGCLWKYRGPRASTRPVSPCTFRDHSV